MLYKQEKKGPILRMVQDRQLAGRETDTEK